MCSNVTSLGVKFYSNIYYFKGKVRCRQEHMSMSMHYLMNKVVFL